MRLSPIIARNEIETASQIIKKFAKEKYRCLIISYETFVNHHKQFGQHCDFLVCDEGHKLKNVKIKIYQALDKFQCLRRIILTGTPVQNNLKELYSCVSFVNPQLFASEKLFRKVYADPIDKGIDKKATDEEKELARARKKTLMEELSKFMIRRTQAILEKFLPKRNEFIVLIKPTSLQATLYEEALQVHRKKNFDVYTNNYGEIFSILTTLRKILNHPKLLMTSETEIAEDLKKRLGRIVETCKEEEISEEEEISSEKLEEKNYEIEEENVQNDNHDNKVIEEKDAEEKKKK